MPSFPTHSASFKFWRSSKVDKRMRLSISFKQQHRHIFEHLKSVPNKSDYICKAVEFYMNHGHSDLHDQIREIVMEILQKSPVPCANQSNIEQSNVLSKEDAELLNQLFWSEKILLSAKSRVGIIKNCNTCKVWWSTCRCCLHLVSFFPSG